LINATAFHLKEEDDDGTFEGIQQKHRQGDHLPHHPQHHHHSLNDSLTSLSDQSLTTDEDDSDDEDFIKIKKTVTKLNKHRQHHHPQHTTTTTTPTPAAASALAAKPVRKQYKQRRTVKSLTEAAVFDENDFTSYGDLDEPTTALKRPYNRSKPTAASQNAATPAAATTYFGQASSLEPNNNNNNNSSKSSDDSDLDLTKLNLTKFNNTTNLFRRLTNLDDSSLNDEERRAGEPAKLTFDQYVKKLTGSYASQAGGLSLKVNPAPSLVNREKLSVPVVVNPAIKAALGRYDTTKAGGLGGTVVNGFSNVRTPQLTVNKILNGGCNGGAVRLLTAGSPVSSANANVNVNGLVGLNKKVLVVNGAGGVNMSGSPSLLKLINVTHGGGGVFVGGKSQLSGIKAVTANSIGSANTSKIDVNVSRKLVQFGLNIS